MGTHIFRCDFIQNRLFKQGKYTKCDRYLMHNVHIQVKAVVGGPAGPASAGPLFWPSMLSAAPLFFFFFFFISAFSVVLICETV